ncbi:MAG TPA: glycosyltransferase family 4 protein [Kineosporiaceae bacterium]
MTRLAGASGRHVLILNRRDSSHPEGGGSEVFLERVAVRLVELGWRVTVLCSDYPGAASEEEILGVRYVRRGGDLSLYPRAALAVAGQAFGRGAVAPCDVIVDVQNGMPFLSPLFTRTPVVNLVHHVHREQWPVVLPAPQARLGWLLESKVAPRVYRGHRYVAVSEATRRELIELGVDPESIGVVHNGTDVKALPAQPRAVRPTVLAVSRLVPHKRLDLAVRAVALLRDRVPGLRLLIAGTGYWERELRDLVARLGAGDQVELLGWVDEDDKHRLMAEAWVMAAPSLKEGWGLSVIEAAAHGTPSVAFHGAGGLSESIIDGQTGLLVHGGGVQGFAAGLEQLLVDRDLRRRMRAAAAAHATGFTWSATAKGMAAVLEDVLAAQENTTEGRHATTPARSERG